MGARRVCVAHLVRRANDPEALRRFMAAYRAHEPGAGHDLVLLLKGFDSLAQAREHLEIADGRVAGTLLLDDSGYDITAYAAAVERFDHDVFCFVNSYSEPRADGWLARLADALGGERVGIAGATGSWGSLLSFLAFQLGARNEYARVFPSRIEARRVLNAAEAERGGGPVEVGRLRHKVHSSIAYLQQVRRFGPFPAAHLRTNGYAATRDVLQRLEVPGMTAKLDAYEFESGRRSLLRQVEALGLRGVVVGRDGTARGPADWPEARVLWQGDQEELLIADNQTEAYRRGDAERRRFLSLYAWGERAAPA